MRALLIDKTGVHEIDIDHTFEGMYQAIGCRWIDGAGYPDASHAAWVDDEGLLQELHGVQATRVAWYPTTLVGKILVTGFDADTGESTVATMTTGELVSMVKIGQFVHHDPSIDQDPYP